MSAWKAFYLMNEANLLENFLVQNYDIMIQVLEVTHMCNDDDEDDRLVLPFLRELNTLSYNDRVKVVEAYQKVTYLALNFWWFKYGWISDNETNVHIDGFQGWQMIENERKDEMYAQCNAVGFLFEPRFIPEIGREFGESGLFVSWLTKDEVKQALPIFLEKFSEQDWRYGGYAVHLKALTKAKAKGCGLIVYQDY